MDWNDLTTHEKDKIRKLYLSPQYKLSNRLLALRIEKDLSQIEAAKKLNMSINEYIRLESGNINVSVEDYRNLILTFFKVN